MQSPPVKHVRISIKTVNYAFDNRIASEVARILRDIAETLDSNGILSVEDKRLFDANGNDVGSISLLFARS